jgi:sugar-specific transcriptional regulator TrmB
MSESVLEEIGLSKTESKIYLSLLKQGTCTVTEIANDAKLHRANVYDSVKILVDSSQMT